MSIATSSPSPYEVIGVLGDSRFELRSKSKTICLRIPNEKDIAVLLEILGNKENSKFDKSISEASVEELTEIARKWTIVPRPLIYLNFIIWQGEIPIGIAGLGWIGALEDEQHPEANLRAGAAGVIIQPFARGQGFAYEALRMAFHHGLHELQLAEIRVGSHSGNESMKGLMEGKFGLKAERSNGSDGVDEFGNDLLWIVTTNRIRVSN